MPAYSPDWAELSPEEPLLEAARSCLVPSPRPGPARVLVFRWSEGAPAKHCGIQSGPDRMIHAYAGTGVVESPLVASWRRRIVGCFAYPLPTLVRDRATPETA